MAEHVKLCKGQNVRATDDGNYIFEDISTEEEFASLVEDMGGPVCKIRHQS